MDDSIELPENINLRYYSPEEAANYSVYIWDLLCEYDNDFVPPLSSRNNSHQSDLEGTDSNTLPHAYFKELHFILVFEHYKIIGFTSFRNGYACNELLAVGPSNYATTTCISKSHRNRGIAQKLYRYLEESIPLNLKLPYVTRRTWSTNTNQIYLFEKLGYELLVKLDNHRGSGIDTVYYGKRIEY
jgi:ribosomal protein S18 acetylase RimI-like enzyme